MAASRAGPPIPPILITSGTIVEGKEDTATEKIARLAEAGIVVAEEISQIPDLVKERIGAGA